MGLKWSKMCERVRWLTGLLQAAGSWSLDACCAVHGNDCYPGRPCGDRASSSDWLFGLWPGPPQRFEPTGTDTTYYQVVRADYWPRWGSGPDLRIGWTGGAPGGSAGDCNQGNTYCVDRASSSDWLFGLGPGPPQRFEPTGTRTDYQAVGADYWPMWGNYGWDLAIGGSGGGPGESRGACRQGTT